MCKSDILTVKTYKCNVYIKDKDSAETTYWRCEKRGMCNGRMITDRIDGSVKKYPSQHNCAPDISSIEAAKTIDDIKFRSLLTDETTSAVINNCTQIISLAASVKLPSKECLSKIVRRKRKAPEVDLFGSVHTTRGQNFLISNDPELDLIILGTEENVHLLTRFRHWFCDGTFDSAPIGYQLYTIHALISNTITIPLVFCIARNKNEATYDKILTSLKEIDQTLNPESVMINAIARNFPTA